MFPQPFGKYVLERELSRGGMARVLLATLRGAGGFEKRLVVKQVRDELAHDVSFVRRFVEEAKTAVALGHPNIVPVYELGVEQGTYFIAMELVEGKSVTELLHGLAKEAAFKESGQTACLTPDEGAYLGIEICRALDYAHRMDVVHRDVTPRNVMVDEEGAVKIIDFGIAAPVRGKSGEVFGSPGHMPPEQAEGKELGPYTDVFAIAALLVEAWTGKPAFRRATPEASEEALRGDVPRPSAANEALAPLDEVVAKALKLDPRERTQAAEELGRALRGYLSERKADVQDVANGLGEKVRRIHARTSPDSTGRSPKVPWRASSPSFSEVSTKTFAVRADVDAWPPADGPATRRMEESLDDDVRADANAPSSGGRGKPLAPAPAEEAAPKSSEATATSDLVATTSRAPTAGSRPNRGTMIAGIALASMGLAVALLSFVQKDSMRGAKAAPVGLGPSTVTLAAEVAQAPATSASAAPPRAPSASEQPRTVGAPSPAPFPSDTRLSGSAALSLLGSADTRIAIDGVAKGSCPLQTSLRPGVHEVRFVYTPTGEARSERLLLKAQEHVTVRADFTAATPTVKVSH